MKNNQNPSPSLFARLVLAAASASVFCACGDAPRQETETIDASKIAALSQGATYDTSLDHPVELVFQPEAFDLSRVRFHIGHDVTTARSIVEGLKFDLAHLPEHLVFRPSEQPASPYGTSSSALRFEFNTTPSGGSGEWTCVYGGNGAGGSGWQICCTSSTCQTTGVDP